MARLFSFLDDPFPYYAVYAYLTVVYLLHQYVKERFAQPLKLKYILAVHNFAMSLVSIVMAAGFVSTVGEIYLKYGWERAYCGVSDEVDEPVYFWINVFWATKYYEFLDTIFIVLEKKTPIFLHIWHHSWVVLVPFIAIRHSLFMGWITGLNNCVVHIFMYFYYGYRSLGYDVWWRKYLTQLQIVQFAIDNISALGFVFYKLVLGVPCSGSWTSWLVGNAVGLSFMLLFLQFYSRQYKAQHAARAESKSSSSAAPSVVGSSAGGLSAASETSPHNLRSRSKNRA